MSDEIVLRGHPGIGPRVEGEALVSHHGFSARYDGPTPIITFPGGRCLRGDDTAVHGALSAALGQPVTLAREAAPSA